MRRAAKVGVDVVGGALGVEDQTDLDEMKDKYETAHRQVPHNIKPNPEKILVGTKKKYFYL